MRSTLTLKEGGISIDAVTINNIRYADDMSILASFTEELRKALNRRD